MSRILGLGTALPPHRVSPEMGRDVARRCFPRLRAADVLPVTRYTAEPLDRVLTPRTLGDAMASYARHAPRLAAQAARQALGAADVRPEDLDAVISVSCTGYMVPSLDVRLVDELGMRRDVTRLPITELGCSGGLAALAAAHRHLLAFPSHRVLVVAVELCSLSFHPQDRSLDNLIAMLVFGDGAAAAVLGGGQPRPAELEVVATASHLIPESSHLLGFDLRDEGFHVVLDSSLPRVIQAGLAGLVRPFWQARASGEPAFHVVHAGGPRVFDAVQASLGLGPDVLAASRRLFQAVGNLSSASILFALAGLEDAYGDGLGIAFGPGVTVELAALRRCPG